MLWAVLTFVAVIFWSVAILVDKYIVSGQLNRYGAILFFAAFGSVIACIAAALIFPVKILDAWPLTIAVTAGIAWITGMLFYYKGITVEEVTRAIPILLASPVFTAILAAVFLNEIFSWQKYVGIALIIIGGFGISTKERFQLRVSKSLLLMVFASLLFSFNGVLLKLALVASNNDNFSVYFWQRAGAAATLPIFALMSWREVRSFVENKAKAATALLAGNLLGATGGVLGVTALSLGYATLVSAIVAIEPLTVLIMAAVAGIFWPNFVREETGLKIFLQKFLWIALMVSGALIVVLI